MCIFSKSVNKVSDTSIFLSSLSNQRHATVYQTKVSMSDVNAMILPVPGESIQFVSMEKYPEFFEDMAKLWPKEVRRSRSVAKSMTLAVERVGDYLASVVPSIADFDKLDPLFKLPEMVWEQLPDYTGFSFVVFKLVPRENDLHLSNKFHPMAYTYMPHDPFKFFFPTVHVHDGKVDDLDDYDHTLYFQMNQHFNSVPRDWEMSSRSVPSAVIDVNKTILMPGVTLVDRLAPICRKEVKGNITNQDYRIESSSEGGVYETRISTRPGRGKSVNISVGKEASKFLFAPKGFSYTTLSEEELIEVVRSEWEDRTTAMRHGRKCYLITHNIRNTEKQQFFSGYTSIELLEVARLLEQVKPEFTTDLKVFNKSDNIYQTLQVAPHADLIIDGKCNPPHEWVDCVMFTVDFMTNAIIGMECYPVRTHQWEQPLYMAATQSSEQYSGSQYANAVRCWANRIRIVG